MFSEDFRNALARYRKRGLERDTSSIADDLAILAEGASRAERAMSEMAIDEQYPDQDRVAVMCRPLAAVREALGWPEVGEGQVECYEAELQFARDRVKELENGLDVICRNLGEPFYSWQRVLYRVQQLIRRRNACAEACLNVIGYLSGQNQLTKELLTQRCVDAVKPIITRDADEPPEFKQESRDVH